MPVDPEAVADARRRQNPGYAQHKRQESKLRSVQARGSTQLGIVPLERSVGDAFRQMLDVCVAEKFFSEESLVPKELSRGYEALKMLEGLLEDDQHAKSKARGDSGRTGLFAIALDPERGEKAIAARELHMWDTLRRTWLGMPAHGGMAIRGKAFVESTVANLAVDLFPRLRSKQLQFVLHQSAGLYSCCRIASRLGLVDLANVTTDVGLWRELNKLTTDFQTARHMSTLHKERAAEAMPNNIRWYWRKQLSLIATNISRLPATAEDLLPRVEWIRALLFSFVTFVHDTHGADACAMMVRRLFCPELARHHTKLDIMKRLRSGVEAVETTPCDGDRRRVIDAARLNVQKELTDLIRQQVENPDEAVVAKETVHPMDAAADAKRLERNTTSSAISHDIKENGLFETFQKARHGESAPDIILRAISAAASNTFREAQLVLKYDPSVSPNIRDSPIDVEQMVEKETDLHEIHKLRLGQQKQQFRQTEVMRVRLFAGRHALGEGKGQHVMEGIHNASLDMLHFYYARKPSPVPSASAGSAASSQAHGGMSKGDEKIEPSSASHDRLDCSTGGMTPDNEKEVDSIFF